MDGFYADGSINGENNVQNPTRILNATLSAVGRSDLAATYKEGSTPQEGADYTVLQGKLARGENQEEPHYNLGDSEGEFLLDPWSGNGRPQNDLNTNAPVGSIIFRQR